MAMARKPDRHAANILPIIREVQRAGAGNLREISVALNVRGVTAARGGRRHPKTASNIVARGRIGIG